MKILKTSLTTLIVAAAMTATQAFAGVMTQTPMPAPVQEPEYFEGFYLGVGAGVVKPNAKVQYDYEASGLPLGDVVGFSTGAKTEDSGKFGFGASIFAGFGRVFDTTTYLGLEIFGNYFDPDMTVSSYTNVLLNGGEPTSSGVMLKTKIENDYSYGILARAGYLFSPKTMFYVLFGIEGSKFEVKSTATVNGLPTTLNMTDKFHDSQVGYLPGAGIETVIADNITLKMQYVYTFYSSFKHSITSTLASTSTYTTKVDPSRGMVSLMLSWYLG